MKHVNTLFFIGYFVYIFLPFQNVLAQVKINEIMYDLPGTDTGREWVELYNETGEAIDISKWVLREAETNHKIEVSQGVSTLSPYGYAVVADNPAKFLIDNPGFSGTLFDSSFSLSNTGETLLLKNGDLDIDTASYTSDMGGLDGMSLNREGLTFKSGTPTPGAVNSVVGTVVNSTTTSIATSATPTAAANENNAAARSVSGGAAQPYVYEQQIFPDAGENRTVPVGNEVLFSGSALGVHKESLLNARFVWNFGDGETKEGRMVTHTYRFLGDYIVTLDVSSGEFSQGDRVLVKVVEPTLFVTQFVSGSTGYTTLENRGTVELDASGFYLEQGAKRFRLPQKTFIAPHGSIKLSNGTSGFSESTLPRLLYANGMPLPIVSNKEASQTLPTPPVSLVDKSKKALPQEVSTIASVGASLASYHKSSDEAKNEDTPNTTTNVLPWGLGLLAFSGLISASVIYVRRSRVEADEYTILEDEE